MSTTLTEEQRTWAASFTGLDLNAPGNATAAGGPPAAAAGGARKAPAKQSAAPNAARIKALADRIPMRVDVFLNTWLISVTQAIDEVPPPQVDDPAAKGNFYTCLAGNMIWAASSLVPEAKVLVVGMSFVGAAIGSGVLNQEATAQPPTPTKELHTIVDKARDALSADYRKRASALAAEVVKGGASGIDDEDHALWSRIFSKADFNSIQSLKADSVRIVTSAVRQYTDQWKEYAAKTEKISADRRMSVVMKMPPAGGGGAMYQDELNNARLENVRKEIPFTPGLKF